MTYLIHDDELCYAAYCASESTDWALFRDKWSKLSQDEKYSIGELPRVRAKLSYWDSLCSESRGQSKYGRNFRLYIKRIIDARRGRVTFQIPATGESISIDVSEFSSEIQKRLMLHGLNAKVGDAAADPNCDAIEVMSRVVELMKEGHWLPRDKK